MLRKKPLIVWPETLLRAPPQAFQTATGRKGLERGFDRIVRLPLAKEPLPFVLCKEVKERLIGWVLWRPEMNFRGDASRGAAVGRQEIGPLHQRVHQRAFARLDLPDKRDSHLVPRKLLQRGANEPPHPRMHLVLQTNARLEKRISDFTKIETVEFLIGQPLSLLSGDFFFQETLLTPPLQLGYKQSL